MSQKPSCETKASEEDRNCIGGRRGVVARGRRVGGGRFFDVSLATFYVYDKENSWTRLAGPPHGKGCGNSGNKGLLRHP
jgi:hypothetical protein